LKAELVLGDSFSDFDIIANNFLDNEYKNQILTYIFCCCFSDALKTKQFKADVAAGVSMGIYAALYHTGSVSFEDGLQLVKTAYQLARKATNGKKFGMASIIGLELSDIKSIISDKKTEVEIANCNGQHSFLLVGNESDLHKVTEACKEEGALHVVTFNASCPYHTSYMKKPSEDFKTTVSKITIKSPEIPLISLIDQTLLKDVEQVKKELVKNLQVPIDWYKSMQTMIDAGINKMIECGPGNSLYKIGKFIEGDFKIYPVNKLHKIGL